MRVLLVGGGAREHALAWKLTKDRPSVELLAAPGNPGIEGLARCFSVSVTDTAALSTLAQEQSVDLTVVGPEAPLAAGIVDQFDRAGLRIFGPTQAAARIESSKTFAKRLMLNASVPTARATWYRDARDAKAAAHDLGAPVVVKASGLAAGKGVVVCESMREAEDAIESVLVARVHGSAGEEVLVEEFMEGEELSVFALSDGMDFVTMLPAQDHKRLGAGDTGPNTGGMGAYAPVSVATPTVLRSVCDGIITRTLTAMSEHGAPFRGLLYCGLMLTAQGPKVVEFNCRFGDPETQAVLPLMTSDLLELLLRATEPGGLAGAPDPSFRQGAAVATVVAAPGYPEAPIIGASVGLPSEAPNLFMFHAGTRRAPDGTLVSAGGRVVTVTAVSDSLDEARRRSRDGAEHVELAGKQYRSDIGWREQRRRAGAA